MTYQREQKKSDIYIYGSAMIKGVVPAFDIDSDLSIE